MSKDATRTIIGPTITIRGKLRSDEDLLIQGRIEAAISSSRRVHVDTGGVVKANIEADSVVVSGIVVGAISAGTRVELTSTARVVGDIATPVMVVNDGARLRGTIDMPAVERAIEEPYVEPAPAPRPLPGVAPVETTRPAAAADTQPPPAARPAAVGARATAAPAASAPAAAQAAAPAPAAHLAPVDDGLPDFEELEITEDPEISIYDLTGDAEKTKAEPVVVPAPTERIGARRASATAAPTAAARRQPTTAK